MENKSKGWFNLLQITVAIVSITFIVWGYYLYQQDDSLLAFVAVLSAIAIVVIGSLYIRRQKNLLASGEVIEDELSEKILYKSGYYAFVASVIMWTFLGSFVDSFEPPRFIIYMGLLGMFLLLMISYLVTKRAELS